MSLQHAHHPLMIAHYFLMRDELGPESTEFASRCLGKGFQTIRLSPSLLTWFTKDWGDSALFGYRFQGDILRELHVVQRSPEPSTLHLRRLGGIPSQFQSYANRFGAPVPAASPAPTPAAEGGRVCSLSRAGHWRRRSDWRLFAQPSAAPHLMVVDSSEIFRTILEMLFEDNGYRVSSSDSIDDAQRLMDRRRVDIALVDVNSPGDYVTAVCALADRTGVPMIPMTADPRTMVFLDVRGQEYRRKPFAPSDILAQVDGALRNARTGPFT